jgi:hypothetical protein
MTPREGLSRITRQDHVTCEVGLGGFRPQVSVCGRELLLGRQPVFPVVAVFTAALDEQLVGASGDVLVRGRDIG